MVTPPPPLKLFILVAPPPNSTYNHDSSVYKTVIPHPTLGFNEAPLSLLRIVIRCVPLYFNLLKINQ